MQPSRYVLVLPVLAALASCTSERPRSSSGSLVGAADVPSDTIYWAVVAGAIRGEHWFYRKRRDVLCGYALAKKLEQRNAGAVARSGALERKYIERTEFTKDEKEFRQRLTLLEEMSLVSQSRLVAGDAYDALVRAGLLAHFVSRDSERAVILFRAALRLVDAAVGDGPSPTLYRPFRVYSALTPPKVVHWHRERLRQLLDADLPNMKPVGARPSKNAQLTTPGAEKGVIEFQSVVDPGFSVCYNAVLEQALLADHWRGNREKAVALYERALQFASIRNDSKASIDRRYLRGRIREIQGELQDGHDRRPASGRSPASVVFRSWMEPGHTASYCRLIDEALLARFYHANDVRALSLYRVARQLANGFDGSTRLSESGLIDEHMAALRSDVRP